MSDGSDGRRIRELELEAFVTTVRERWGYDFSEYSRPSLMRRVTRAADFEGLSTISELQGRVLRDAEALQRFVGHAAVGYTSMFRDAGFYQALRTAVLPVLRTWPYLRIWHAGCSTGEEVYSMAILLEEAGLYDRCRIYATDVSRMLYERARQGTYPLRVMRRYTEQYLAAGGTRDFSSYYRADDRSAVFNPSLRRNMVFSGHNLVSDRVFNRFHVVLCRNVLIYFLPALRSRVHGLLHQSLERFGYLGLGEGESLPRTAIADCYEPLDGEAQLFRKIR